MHVLVTADTVGGVWTYSRELVSGLVRRGVRVTLVSFGEIPETSQISWMDGLHNFDFRPTCFRLEWMQDSEADIAASTEYLLGVIRETHPDLLHLSQFCYGALNVDVPKIVVAHSDVVSWWVSVHGEAPPDSEWIRWYRGLVQRGLDNATIVSAPSRWMLAQIEKHYGPHEGSSVVYNGRTPEFFNPHTKKDDIVVSVGRLWDTGKQVSILSEAESSWPKIIAGVTKHPVDSSCAASSLVGGGSLEFKGSQTSEQLQALFSRAGIYAATSRYEPFGLAPLEAALSRCAIVANDIPTFRELWGDAVCYFRTNDSESLTDSIARLQNDRALCQHYAELVYLRAQTNFTADRMLDEYLQLYKSILPTKTWAA